MLYTNNEQLVIELKKLMIDCKISQKEVADKLGIKPQGLTKILNKKNLSFEDIQKIVNTLGYDLTFNFNKKQDAQ